MRRSKACRLGKHGHGRFAWRALYRLDERIAQYDSHIQAIARENERDRLKKDKVDMHTKLL